MAIHLSRIDELALVALDRPEALNALSVTCCRTSLPLSTKWGPVTQGPC
jgi:hypothetical protein